MLVRVFGLFGIILGAAYFNEGVAYTGLLRFAVDQKLQGHFITYLLFVTWDFLFGTSLIVAGIGLLLLREWARFMWLGLMPALVLIHFGIIVVNQLFGDGVGIFYLVWTAMVVAVAVLSWWYMTKDRIRACFARQLKEPAVAEDQLT